jgi:O-antigen ligase
MPTPRPAWLSRLFLLTIIPLVCAAAAGLAWTAAPAPAVPLPEPDPRIWPLYGINLSPWHLSEAEWNAQLEEITRILPGGWVRIRFRWAELEPAPGQFDWTSADRVVNALRGRPLRLLAVLETSPAWARSEQDQDNPYAPPRERRNFGAFAAAFAGRYGDVADAYQIWDEPNIAPHWGNRYVNAGEYTDLLREAALQIRPVDPDALILAGGLAPNIEPGGLNQSDIIFLREMYAAGAAEWFDALAAKPYGLRAGPTDPPDPGQLNFQRAALLRQVMVEAGDGATPIWGVEFGWNSLPAGWQGAPSPWGTTDEETQARWTREAAGIARRSWPWMGPLLWAEWRPDAPADDPRWGFAAVDKDGRPRPVLESLRALPALSETAGAGVHAFWEPSVTTEGQWRIAPDGADIGEEGAAMRIRFVGTGIDLAVRRGPYWAYLEVSVDGQPANALPRDEAGRSYLVLYDPLRAPAVVPLARGLPAGFHEARIVAHGGWDQWALAHFAVHEGTPARSPWSAAVLGALAGLLIDAVLLVRTRGSLRRLVSAPVRLWERAHTWFTGRPFSLRLGLLAAAGALFLLAPGPILPLAGLLSCAAIILLWPPAGLILAPASFPLFLRPPLVFGRAIPNLESILWLTLAGLLWTAVLRGGLQGLWGRLWRTRSWVDAGVLGLLFAAGLSTIFAEYPGVAGHELRTVFLDSALLYALWRAMPAGRDERRWLWAAVDALLIGGVIAALAGIAQWFSGAGVITAEGVARVRAWYGSPNNLALYLERVAPLALSAVVFGGVGRRRWTYGLALLPILAALYLTFSRGAWLLGLPAALIGMGAARGGKWRWGALAGVLLIGAALLPLAGTERLQSLLDTSAGTGFVRLKLWQGTWNMIREHPVLGVGPDNFLYLYRTRYVLPGAWEELNLSHPHNIVLDAWTRTGIVGLAALGVLVAALARRLWRGARQSARPAERMLYIGLFGSLAASLAHGLIDNSFFLADLAMVLMMTAGLALRLAQPAEEQ